MKVLKTMKLFICGILLTMMVFTGNYSYSEVIDKVIVVVNDEVVTQREFDRIYGQIKKSFEAAFKGEELAKRLEEAREGVLDQLINSKLAVSLAKKQNIKVDDEEVNKRISSIESYYENEDTFLRALSDKGTTLTEFEKEIRDQMLAQKLVEKEVASRIVISPGEMRELYDANKDKFIEPKSVKVRGILVRKNDNNPDAVKAKIESVMEELSAGKDFGAMAKQYSEGPYAESDGDMGYIAPGQTLEKIDEVIFSTPAGSISDIVETNIGYHIFKIEDARNERQLEFDEVSDFIRQQIHMRKFEQELLKWLEEKRKNAYISYK